MSDDSRKPRPLLPSWARPKDGPPGPAAAAPPPPSPVAPAPPPPPPVPALGSVFGQPKAVAPSLPPPPTMTLDPEAVSDDMISGLARSPRPLRSRLAGPADAPAPSASQPGIEDAGWPATDDRLAAVRRLIPRQESTEPVIPVPKQEAPLPEPMPEPRRAGVPRRSATPTPLPPAAGDGKTGRRFRPGEPATLEQAGLDDGLIEGLVVKHLYNSPGSSGRSLAHEIGLRPSIIQPFLEDLKMRRLAIHRSAAAMGDFYYELTEEGRALARDLQKDSRYAGSAPVPLDQYIVSVKAQAISTEHPRRSQLAGAFADLLVPGELVDRIGPAMTHGKGMFMFGPPGNGKTSLAERITRAYGSTIYIPFAIFAGGQIIQIFDPAVHIPVDESDVHPGLSANRLDRRWIRCRRPTVVVGGELTLEALDIVYDEVDGVCEAPIQLKANGGTLVIDDFGRQRCRPDELLNRWIVPLEKQVDYIALPGGRKESFPFECLLIFSTNMEPRDLVDEAFLRRIPYKIEVTGPSDAIFRELCERQAKDLDLRIEPGALDYLISEHFEKIGRATRYCHPRDLMLQIHNLCRFRETPRIVDQANLDAAVKLYFSVL